MTNIFETASRQAFRFPSDRGLLTTEDLWALPLKAGTKFDLDSVAKAVHAELQEASDTSFVETKVDPRQGVLETQLEVVKHVIAVKIAERDARQDAAAKRAEKDRLLEILAAKRDESLTALSEEEIRAKIEALG